MAIDTVHSIHCGVELRDAMVRGKWLWWLLESRDKLSLPGAAQGRLAGQRPLHVFNHIWNQLHQTTLEKGEGNIRRHLDDLSQIY